MRWLPILLLAGCLTPPETITLRTPEGVVILTVNTRTGEARLTAQAWWMLHAR